MQQLFCYKNLRPYYYWSNEEGNCFSQKELDLLLKLSPFTTGIGGHTTRTYLDYQKVVKNPVFYFTFLRNPVDRYMSHLNYQIHSMNIQWDIEEFVEEKDLITIRRLGLQVVKT